MFELIIIGGGPAGLTAGLYAARFRINVLLIEKIAIGGQILISATIENFPGFPGGIQTEELINRFKKQVDDLGLNIEIAEVAGVDILGQSLYGVKTENKTIETKAVIVACGAGPKMLGVEGEDRFKGRGVSYCAICDAPLFKNKEVTVVGGGDKAVEEAIFLSSYAAKVNLVHRRSAFRAAEILLEKAKALPKINFILDSEVKEIVGSGKVEAVKIKNIVSGITSEISSQGVFIFVGIKPNTGFLKNQLKMDERDFIITDEKMQTSVDGVFACGDCRQKSLYQVINACGEAAVAAHSTHSFLLEK